MATQIKPLISVAAPLIPRCRASPAWSMHPLPWINLHLFIDKYTYFICSVSLSHLLFDGNPRVKRLALRALCLQVQTDAPLCKQETAGHCASTPRPVSFTPVLRNPPPALEELLWESIMSAVPCLGRASWLSYKSALNISLRRAWSST